MDEELKTKLLTYLNDVEAAAKTGKDFLIEQAPLYVQELLAWEFWSGVGIAVLAGIPVLVVMGIALWACLKSDDASNKLFALFMGGVVSVLPGGFAVQGAHTAAKVSIAPRVVIVDKLREAVK